VTLTRRTLRMAVLPRRQMAGAHPNPHSSRNRNPNRNPCGSFTPTLTSIVAATPQPSSPHRPSPSSPHIPGPLAALTAKPSLSHVVGFAHFIAHSSLWILRCSSATEGSRSILRAVGRRSGAAHAHTVGEWRTRTRWAGCAGRRQAGGRSCAKSN
jgi:hypothetical protein